MWNLTKNLSPSTPCDREVTGMTEKKYSDIDIKRQTEKLIPSGRITEPKDIANVVLFLLSDLSAYINGETIFVDGGYSIFK
jgi:enoyl-[acyl-carrier-protein] reductase (NADH)